MKAEGLYDPRAERDSCGVGFVLNLDGRAEHRIVEKGIEVLENLPHCASDGGGSGHGRRRGLADPDAGRIFPGGGEASGVCAAGSRRSESMPSACCS